MAQIKGYPKTLGRNKNLWSPLWFLFEPNPSLSAYRLAAQGSGDAGWRPKGDCSGCSASEKLFISGCKDERKELSGAVVPLFFGVWAFFTFSACASFQHVVGQGSCDNGFQLLLLQQLPFSHVYWALAVWFCSFSVTLESLVAGGLCGQDNWLGKIGMPNKMTWFVCYGTEIHERYL